MVSGLVKWDPFGEMSRLFSEMDRIFESFWKAFPAEIHSVRPIENEAGLQVRDDGEELVITGEISGADKDKLDVAIHQDHVVIRGEATTRKDDAGGRMFYWSRFAKVHPLPVKVKSDKAHVDIKDGKIKIIVPKMLNNSSTTKSR